jgi:peptidyl-prolyl cis-trans isomerase C
MESILLQRPARGALLAALLVAMFLATGCSRNSGFAKMDDKTLADVDGVRIAVEDLNDRYGRLEKELGNPPKGKAAENAVKRAIVKELVDRALLLAEAKRRGLTVTREEIEQEKTRLWSGLEPDEFKEAMAEAHVTPDRLEEKIRQELLVSRLTGSIVADGAVSDAEAAAYYAKNKDRFFTQEAVRARQIIVGTEDDARQARRRVLAGEKFEEVAADLSQSPDVKKGGDLGFFQKGEMPKAIEDVAFALNPGQVSQVIESPYGYHVIRVEERKPPRQRELSEVRGEIVEAVLTEKREERYRAYLGELSLKARVKYNRKYEEFIREKKKK